MAKTKNPPLTIDGVEYVYEDMTQQQQLLLNHVGDLDRKLDAARFNVDQLQVGRNAFFGLLKEALAEPPPSPPIEDATLSTKKPSKK